MDARDPRGSGAVDDEIVYGQHAVSALLDTAPQRVREVWLQRDRDNRLSERLRRRFQGGAVPMHVLSRRRLDELLDGARHQGVAVRVAPGAAVDLRAVLRGVDSQTLLVLLDGVQDPRNLGAVLRSAAAAGATGVIHPRSRGAGLTGAARKTAAGAAERIAVVEVANLARAMAALADAGVRLVGLDGAATGLLYDTDLTGPLALVLGAEDRGLRRLTRDACDERVALPMAPGVDSLNVSVAAGVCLYEALRQRRAARSPGRDPSPAS